MRLGALLEAVDAGENAKTVAFLARARHRYGALAAILEAADLGLLRPDAWNPVKAAVDEAIGQLEQLGDDPDFNQDYVDDAGLYLGDALAAAAPLLVAAPIVAPDQQRETAAAYRRSVGQLLRAVTEERDSASAKLDEVRQEADELRRERAAQVAATRKQLDDLQAQIEAQEDRAAAVVTRLQADFQQAEEARQKAATDAAAEIKAAAATQRDELANEAADALEALERHRAEAARLVNAVGQNAFAGGFGEYANDERAAANRWRLITVASIIAIVAAGFSYLWTVGASEFSLQAFWIRAVIIVPLAFLAGYAARQSGRHRRNEVAARDLALKLLALDPYLELLPEEDKQKVKIKMADTFFGTPPQPIGEDSVGLQEAIEALAKALQRK